MDGWPPHVDAHESSTRTDSESPVRSSERPSWKPTVRLVGIGVGVFANACGLAVAASLFDLHPGEEIRHDMGFGLGLFCSQAIGVFLGVPLCLVSMSSRKDWLALVGVLLNLSPFLVAICAARAVIVYVNQ